MPTRQNATQFLQKVSNKEFELIEPISASRAFVFSFLLSWLLSFSLGSYFEILFLMYHRIEFIRYVFWQLFFGLSVLQPLVIGWKMGPKLGSTLAAMIILPIAQYSGYALGLLGTVSIIGRPHLVDNLTLMHPLTHLLLLALSAPSLLSLGLSRRMHHGKTPKRFAHETLKNADYFLAEADSEGAIELYKAVCGFLEEKALDWNENDESLNSALSLCKDRLQLVMHAYDSVDSISDLTKSSSENVMTYRGCEVVGNKFEYKVKIQNKGRYVINNVTITIVSYPSESLKLIGESAKKINRIEVGGFRSPQFSFIPTKDCVEGNIEAVVSFSDATGETYSKSVKPYRIRSVCDLLQPLEIANEKIKNLIVDFENVSSVQRVPFNIHNLEDRVKNMLVDRNFTVIDTEEETGGGQSMVTIRATAIGKHTRKYVIVVFTLSGNTYGSETSIQAEVFGEDISMLPTTLAEISLDISSWACIHCGGGLSPHDVVMLKNEIPVVCRYCEETVEMSMYTSGGVQ